MDVKRIKKSVWILVICFSLLASVYTSQQYQELDSQTILNHQVLEQSIFPDVDLLERSYQKAKKLIRILKL